MNKKTIRDVNLTGKRVLVRVDFNVPMEDQGGGENDMIITDDTRIRESIPTLKYILDQNPYYVVLMTHLGRPKGKVVPNMSVKPIIPILAEYLGQDVILAGDSVGKYADEVVENAPEGSVILLQNTRFYKEDEANDPAHAAKLAKYGDVFVNDAFGTAHRAHASNVGVAAHMETVAGFLMEKELDFLVGALENPDRPFMAVMGGAKVSDKVPVIRALIEKVDRLLLGGGIGITFWRANGAKVANSLVDEEALPIAKEILEQYGSKIVLPTEVVIADRFDNEASSQTIDLREEDVPDGWQILDAGKGTLDYYKGIMKTAQTVLWNGPLGVFEMPNFAHGTFGMAKIMADLTARGAKTIIGGGDSAAAVEKAGLADQMTHMSTGGGASLELLEGRVLPGVDVIADK